MMGLLCLAGLALTAMLLGQWNTPAPGVPAVITQPLAPPGEAAATDDDAQDRPEKSDNGVAQSDAAVPMAELPINDLVGSDASKRADSFYLNPRANLTLFKRKYNDNGEGQRLDMPRGAETRVTLASDEVVRFAIGTQAADVGLFYQGRAAPATLIESGHWIRFVGRSP